MLDLSFARDFSKQNWQAQETCGITHIWQSKCETLFYDFPKAAANNYNTQDVNHTIKWLSTILIMLLFMSQF